MRSSSGLFPVSLIAAEVIGDLHDDAYLLNPGISQDPTVRVAVTRITDPRHEGQRPAVVLLHSEFNNRLQWLSGEGGGLAKRLAEAGYDVWLPEMRGHGRSPRNRDWANNNIIGFSGEDWPAVHRFVMEQSGKAPLWVAQGLGAISLAHMLLNLHRTASRIPAVVFIEPGTPRSHWLHRTLSRRERWRFARRDRIAGPWGPEEEPAAVFRMLFAWQRSYRKGEAHPIYDRLRAVRNPALVASNGNDDQVRAFSGLLGSQVRRTVVANKGRALPKGTAPACALPDQSLQLEIAEWLDKVRASVNRGLVSETT